MRVLLGLLMVGIAGCGEGSSPPGDVAAPSSPAISPVKAENAEAGASKTKPVSPGSEPNVPGGMEVTNSIGMKLRLIPAGEFMMGSPETAPPVHDLRGPSSLTSGEFVPKNPPLPKNPLPKRGYFQEGYFHVVFGFSEKKGVFRQGVFWDEN